MPERPIECTECKRTIAVEYTEIANEATTQLCMCAECPILHQKLHGLQKTKASEYGAPSAGLCCGRCGTSLDAVKTGSPLGCSECYEVFDDVLTDELLATEKISARIRGSVNKKAAFHMGRSPGETVEMNPSLQLLALSEALNETLTREDYEQAAWLRDQIKALQQKQDSGDADEGKKG